MIRGLLLCTAIATLTVSCASSDKVGEPGGNVAMLPEGAALDPYLVIIERFSEGESEYRGFYNQFTYRATLLNAPIREALMLREADYFKWSPEQLAQAKSAAETEMATKTEIFLSFYTPERRNDNMMDPKKSVWRIYLDVGNQRFMGVPRKAKKAFAELASLYPYHTRWNSPYLVTFEVPTTVVQTRQTKLTVTGPLGTKEVYFPAVE